MPRKEKKGVSHLFKKFDLFGEQVSFEVEGEVSHKTCLGALISLAIIAVTVSYAATRITVMKNYGDTVHQTTTEPANNFLPQETTGFAFAFVIKNLWGGVKTTTDLSPYVKIAVGMNNKDEGNKILPYRNCTEEDIGKFTGVSDQNAQNFLKYSCFSDPSQLLFSNSQSLLYFQIYKCSDDKRDTNCESEEEIDKLLKNSFVQIFYNQQDYDPNNFDGIPVKKSLGKEKFLLNTPTTVKRQMMPQRVESEEIFFNPGWFPSKEIDLYNVQEGTFQSWERPAAFTLVMTASRERQNFNRSIYNVLDFLGDIGGLYDALKLIAGSFVGLATQGGLMRTLINNLFFEPTRENRDDNDPQQDTSTQQMVKRAVKKAQSLEKARIPFNFDCLFQWCSSRARGRKKRFDEGSARISKQLDVVSFIESQITLAALVRVQMSRMERFLARHQQAAFVLSKGAEEDLVVRDLQDVRDQCQILNDCHARTLADGVLKPGSKRRKRAAVVRPQPNQTSVLNQSSLELSITPESVHLSRPRFALQADPVNLSMPREPSHEFELSPVYGDNYRRRRALMKQQDSGAQSILTNYEQ